MILSTSLSHSTPVTCSEDATPGPGGFAYAAAAITRLPGWKRFFDLIFVFATVFIWLPLIVIIMWVIKIVSPGPAFYRQQRVGYRGQSFMIFKFRSMKMNAETRTHEQYLAHLIKQGGPMTKLDGSDTRLIPLGRFLRATGLDELPQIFNILRGDMSLVGPRPCTTVEFARYEPWQKDRVNVQPGVTGYWQVNGKNKTTFGEMIAMDLFYVGNVSLWLDIVIIFKTLPVLMQEAVSTTQARRHETKTQQFDAGTLRRQLIPLRDD
jgi:lipopolysaccharide/colanic/teichoic acid biosynthesis glycosyltransferase